MLEQRMAKKIKQLESNHGDEAIRGQGVINYWQTLHLQLQQAANNPTSAVIVETATAEQHACPTCGMYYPTKKALRQHQALRHGQIQAVQSLPPEALQLAGAKRPHHAQCL